MVKHIVLFQLKDSVSEDVKRSAADRFKQAIEALPQVIPTIRKIEVSFNINPSETWHVALYSEFDTLADVEAYAVHPAHKVAGALLNDVKAARACVDYEIECL
jgi:hypothetical protein